MPTKKKLSLMREAEFEYPQIRREDDPGYKKPEITKTITHMESKEIIEGNKLIAEFMGWRFETIHDQYGGELLAYFQDELRWRGERPEYLDTMCSSEHGYAFHCDWNKLMPVVEKIEAMDHYSRVTIENNFCGINDMDELSGVGDSKIDAVWKAVLCFVNWYNSLSPSPTQNQ
jgi:hypothetical protein